MSTTTGQLIREERQIDETDVIVVDGYFVSDRTLSMKARFLGLLLQTFVDTAGPTRFPSVDDLRSSSGWSSSTLQKYETELQDRGWLRVQFLRDRDGRLVKCFTVGHSTVSNVPSESPNAER